MLPRADVLAWRSVAPWADEGDVEQDLVITRALLDLCDDPLLADRLAFRGGTALHKLYLAPAARYSDDIATYMERGGDVVPTAAQMRANLAKKHADGVFAEVIPLLRSGVAYEPAVALDWFETTLIARLPRDDGSRAFALA